MVHVNRTGNEFQPLGYPGVDYETAQGLESEAQLQDGLYYRSKIFPGLAAAVDACKSGEQSYGQLSLEAYQAWDETGWKKPHTTFDTVERFSLKAREEAREVDDALEEYWATRNADHLIEELGDYLWITTAIASNGAAVISDAIKQRLYEYGHGTKVSENGDRFTEPEWYDAAMQLAIKRDSVTVNDLDELIRAGFVPRFSPIMNLYEKEDICCTSYAFDFSFLAVALDSLSRRQYSHGEGNFVFSEEFRQLSEELGKLVSEIYFRTAAMAYFVKSSLAEVVQVNIEKISERVANGTIDKTDGPRTTD